MVVNSGITYEATTDTPEAHVSKLVALIENGAGEIIMRHKNTLIKRTDGDVAICEILSGFKTTPEQIKDIAAKSYLTLSNTNWDNSTAKKFAAQLLKATKPLIVAANKADQAGADAFAGLSSTLVGTPIVKCSAAIELALIKAANKGIVDYYPGAKEFKILKEINPEQKSALNYMQQYITKNGGTGVQELLNTAVFKALSNIVVYPVEDEGHYSDHSGNILPDAILMEQGSTAYDLAAKIHTEIARGMKYAVDAKTKMRIQKEHILKDGDVIKIVSTAK